MESTELHRLNTLKNIFPEESWPWVISALRRTPQIWDNLESVDFSQALIKSIGTDPEDWTPGRIGAVQGELSAAEGISWPIGSFADLPARLQGKVQQVYQDAEGIPASGGDLESAFWLALALLGELASGKDWQEIISHYLARTTWRVPLVMLFALAKDKVDFLRVFEPDLAFDILLSNPLAPDRLADLLVSLLASLDTSELEKWLKAIHKTVPDLAARIADSLLEVLELDPSSMTELLILSLLNQLTGRSQTALELLELASDKNQKLQGKLAANLNKVKTRLVEPQAADPSWQELKSALSDQKGLGENFDDVAAIIRSLLEKKHLTAAGELISKLPDPLPNNPELLLALGEYAQLQKQPLRAQQLAQDVYEQTLGDPAPPEGLSSLLNRLGLFAEAARSAQRFLERYPNHLAAHLDNLQALRDLGNYAEAAKSAQIISVLFPQDLALQRELAAYLEEAESWKEALEIRSTVLAKLQTAAEAKIGAEAHLPVADLKDFAECALQAEQPNRAISACNQILAQEPENSLALSLQGRCLCSLGEVEEGLALLTRAVESSPVLEDGWVNLAICNLQAGLVGQAQQNLKSGLASAATTARILKMLGQIESQQGNHSKALERFQEAGAAAEQEQIDPKSLFEIRLGESLAYYELGHRDQAREHLKSLNERYPSHQQANYIYGKLLLEAGDAQHALPYFVQVIDRDPGESEPYLTYADALLQAGSNPAAAIKAVSQALALDPENKIALVLQGEAKLAAGENKAALGHFQNARESALLSDAAWSPRISAGLGKAALILGETETAIAALKDGQDRFPRDLRLTKTLAEAYLAGDLPSNALEAARKAAEIAPQDPDNLTWVANFTLKLGSPQEGISALQKLIRLNPGQPTPYLLLGKAQAEAGDTNAALGTLAEISRLDSTSPDDYLAAGEILLGLEQLGPALKHLEKAVNICQANPEPSGLLPRIWAKQAEAYEKAGDPQLALEVLDKAIAADLDQPEWRIQKADILIRQDRLQAALASLSNALDLSPGQPDLHLKMARIQVQIASFEDAYHHAQEALSGYQNERDPDPERIDSARAAAADLAAATLREQAAADLLADLDPARIDQEDSLSDASLHAFCLAAELALDQNQEIKAAEISNLLVSHRDDHPRVNALQARVLNRQGDAQEALVVYTKAAQRWHESEPAGKLFPVAVELALGHTALELHSWQQAAAHYQHAAELASKEKRTLRKLAGFFIHRAEIRRLTDTLRVVNRAPGVSSTSNEVYQSLQGCISGLAHLDADPDLVAHLQKRGEAVFSPSQESADALKEISRTAEELAAVIGSYRACRQMVLASQVAQQNISRLGENPRLDSQISLALLRSKPEAAFKAASSALEAARRANDPQLPMYFVCQALAANRANESASAEEAISKALQYWNDEPHWYALAAEISPDYSRAVECYQQAIVLDPKYGGHYLSLGKRHLQARQPLPAVKAFEKAIALNPDHVEAWIQRSLAKHALHRMPEALSSINQALSLAPEHKEARKTAALLYFENGSYRESEKHLVSLLGQDPHDTDLLALFAKTLAAQKQYDQAFRVIEKAIALEEDPLALQLQRAGMVKQVEGPSAAIDELRIIGSHYPGRFPQVLELVETLAEAGEIEQAVRTAQEALVDEEHGYNREQQAHLHLTAGRLLRAAGQLDQAVHHLHQAKGLVDPNYHAVLELGRVHHDRREYELALEQMEKAIAIEPQEAEAYYQAGRILKDLKDYDQAERMLRRAAKLAPNDLKIHRQLGVLVTLNLVHGDARREIAA